MVARKRAKKFRRYGWTQKKSAVYPPQQEEGTKKEEDTRSREGERESKPGAFASESEQVGMINRTRIHQL